MTVALVVALAVVVPVVVTVHAVGERREALDARRSTVRAIRRLQSLVGECTTLGPDACVDAVRRALGDVLGVERCWFEPDVVDDGMASLDRDGSLSTLVQRRGDVGLVLPAPVAIPTGRGRFVLFGSSASGTTPEQRVIAVAMADLAALATYAQTTP